MLLGQAGQVAVSLAGSRFNDHLGQAAGHIQHEAGAVPANGLADAVAQAVVAELAADRRSVGHADQPVGRVVGKGAGSVVAQVAVIIFSIRLAIGNDKWLNRLT